MSILVLRKFCRLGVVLALSAALCVSLQSLTAGEAIQFSPSKGKAEPAAPNNKLPKEKLSNLDRLPSSNPLDTANQARPAGDDPGRPKTRQEKMRKLKELEDKNWTEVESGQLRDEENEKTSMGVREYDIETGGKEKTSSDIWLNRKRSDNSRAQGNPRSRGTAARGPGQSQPQPARDSDDSDSGLKISITGGQTGGQTPGAPAVGDLKLNNTLASDPASGGLRDAFSAANADQNRRGDVGLRSFDASAGPRPSSLGGGDSPAFGRGDLSARSALSASPGLLDAPKSQPSGSFAQPGGNSGFGLSGSRYSSPAFNDSSLTPRSGFGNSASPLTEQRNQFTPGSSRDAFAPPPRPSSGR